MQINQLLLTIMNLPQKTTFSQIRKEASGQNRNQNLTNIVVVDTNVCLHHIREIYHIIVNEWQSYSIYVPRKVIEELDLKKNLGSEEEKKKARFANRILYEISIAYMNLRRIQFQNITEAEKAYKLIPPTKKADDLIVATCFKLKLEGKSVLLFSYDFNMQIGANGFGIGHYPEITQEKMDIMKKILKRRFENVETYNGELNLIKKILNADPIKRRKIIAILDEDSCEKWFVFLPNVASLSLVFIYTQFNVKYTVYVSR